MSKTSKPTPTPGPWTEKPYKDHRLVYGADGQALAQCNFGNDEANARLIALAPELLDAVKVARKMLKVVEPQHGNYFTGTLASLEAIIARADGRG